jgi:cytochrome P450
VDSDSTARIDRASGTGSRQPMQASVADTVRVGALVLAPMVAQGVILRRPWAVALVQRLDLDRRANRLLDRLRTRYGGGPVRLRLPGRRAVLLLSPPDIERVLAGSPEPFALDNREKHGALAHFQPHGVLLSRGPLREERRRLNEGVLDADQDMHRLGWRITAVVREEAAALLSAADTSGLLRWPEFAAGFGRIVRRVVLGDAAGADEQLTATLTALRARANWSSLLPPNRGQRERLTASLASYLDRAGPGSLAGLLAAAPASPEADRVGQLPHWLFAFDAAGIATFRALALLATHPEQLRRARQEHADPGLPYLRACVLESVRLWPTTLVLLRDSTGPTVWGQQVLPAGTAFLVPSSFLHRDARLLLYADQFSPEAWLDGRARDSWSVLPFSGGPGRCPGRNLVLLVTSTLLAELLREHRFTLTSRPRPGPDRPVPASLDHFRLRFAVTRTDRPDRTPTGG